MRYMWWKVSLYLWNINRIQYDSLYFFACLCGRFKTWSSLNDHRRSKHSNRRFNCTQCGRSFRFQTGLVWHLDQHARTSEDPFVCDVCGKGFRVNFSFHSHLRKMHGLLRNIHTYKKFSWFNNRFKCFGCINWKPLKF